MDFYEEGDLIWLEADVLIRQQSEGRRSLDDFCKKFLCRMRGPPKIIPYPSHFVVTTLNEIAPYDWRSFFDTRLHSLAPHAPMGGI